MAHLLSYMYTHDKHFSHGGTESRDSSSPSFYERTKVANAPKRARREKTLSPALPLYGEGEPSGKSLALVTPLAIEGERGWG